MQAEAKVLVTEQIAESLSSRPDRVQECMLEAEQAMNEFAADDGRTTSEPPRLVSHRKNGLGFVELTFHAETRPL